jgi:hypothetical protein
MDRVPSKALVEAGLEVMRRNGNPLERRPSKGRAQIYSSKSGQSVRLRTCNDHVLIVVSERPDPSSPVNIEGTDLLLIVIAKERRQVGEVLVFLVPTEVAVKAAREGYKSWLDRSPVTRGKNTTWNIWFDETGLDASHGFMKKWHQYLLPSEVSSVEFLQEVSNDEEKAADSSGQKPSVKKSVGKSAAQLTKQKVAARGEGKSSVSRLAEPAGGTSPERLGDVIAQARSAIAIAAGVDQSNVKITLELG